MTVSNNQGGEFIRQQTWLQTVVSQHSIHATLAGLEINALILFVTFFRDSFNDLQKILFVLELVSICISVWCIIWMVEHERKDAYDSSQISNNEREKENCVRFILNWTNKLSVVIVALLLIISVY